MLSYEGKYWSDIRFEKRLQQMRTAINQAATVDDLKLLLHSIVNELDKLRK